MNKGKWLCSYSVKAALSGIAMIASLIVVPSGGLMAQETSMIRGKVLDSITGEPVYGVTVIVQGQNQFAQTDFDGKYQLQLPPGSYTLVYQMVGFENRSRVVNVEPGQAVSVNVTMGTPAATEAEVVVTGRSLNNTEASLLALQKKAPNVTDGISAEAIKKSPDSSAGDVLKRVTGITLIGGKYVFVRGLGERYSTTMLNGANIASPIPDKRVIPMDLFPASLIKNIRVMKTFLPEYTAEFSGGLVQIETKEYPDEFTLIMGAGLGYNSITTGRHFKQVKGGGNDYLGLGPNDFFGFGSEKWAPPQLVRELPNIAPLVEGDTLGGIPASLVELAHAGFNQDWSPRRITAPVDKSLSFTIGDSILFDNGMKFGYIFGSSYSRKYRKRKTEDYRYDISVPFGNESLLSDIAVPAFRQVQFATEHIEEVLWGNNLNLAFTPINGHQFTSRTFYSTQGEKEYRLGLGYNDQPQQREFINENSGYIANEILHHTFGGKHAANILSNGKPHEIEWTYGYSLAGRDQPDFKTRGWEKNPGSADPAQRIGTDGRRFYSRTEDVAESFKISYELPYEQWDGLQSKLKFGYEAIDRTKDFESRTYLYQRLAVAPGVAETFPTPGEVTFNPARIFAQEYRFGQQVGQNDTYEANQKLHAYFIQTDLPVTSKLRVTGGFRYEDNYQKTITFPSDRPYEKVRYGCTLDGELEYLRPQLIGANICDRFNNGVGENRGNDIFPSLNIVYEVIKDMNLRLGYSETVTRPDLRELSEFFFTPYYGADRVQGNAFLDRTYIHNYDFRWEWYLSATDYIGAGLFLKNLSSPIELVGQPASGDGSRTFVFSNGDQGKIQGIEVDFRKDFLTRFRVEANIFLIKSQVTVRPWIEQYFSAAGLIDLNSKEALLSPTDLERELQGQSDLVYNAKISYFLDEAKTMSTGLFYNYYGDRISAAGSQGEPNVVEKGKGFIDLVFEYQSNDNLSMKASIKNITGEKYESVQEFPLLGSELPYNSYTIGTDFSVSASYKF
ncbi:MAG: TonB-dependent receptor [Leptospiraceae bacterium]